MDTENQADEGVVSSRERDAERALRAAVFGLATVLLFLPFELYAVWLLWRVWRSREPLDAGSRRRAKGAALISIPLVLAPVALLGTIIVLALLGKLSSEPQVNPRDLNRPIALWGTWEGTLGAEDGGGKVVMELKPDGTMIYTRRTGGNPPFVFVGSWGYANHGLVYRIETVHEGDVSQKGKVYLWPVERRGDGEVWLEGQVRFVRKP